MMTNILARRMILIFFFVHTFYAQEPLYIMRDFSSDSIEAFLQIMRAYPRRILHIVFDPDNTDYFDHHASPSLMKYTTIAFCSWLFISRVVVFICKRALQSAKWLSFLVRHQDVFVYDDVPQQKDKIKFLLYRYYQNRLPKKIRTIKKQVLLEQTSIKRCLYLLKIIQLKHVRLIRVQKNNLFLAMQKHIKHLSHFYYILNYIEEDFVK